MTDSQQPPSFSGTDWRPMMQGFNEAAEIIRETERRAAELGVVYQNGAHWYDRPGMTLQERSLSRLLTGPSLREWLAQNLPVLPDGDDES